MRETQIVAYSLGVRFPLRLTLPDGSGYTLDCLTDFASGHTRILRSDFWAVPDTGATNG